MCVYMSTIIIEHFSKHKLTQPVYCQISPNPTPVTLSRSRFGNKMCPTRSNFVSAINIKLCERIDDMWLLVIRCSHQPDRGNKQLDSLWDTVRVLGVEVIGGRVAWLHRQLFRSLDHVARSVNESLAWRCDRVLRRSRLATNEVSYVIKHSNILQQLTLGNIFVCFHVRVFLVCLLSLKPVFMWFLLGFLGYHSLYIVCVSCQLNVRSTMEIRRSRLCDYSLVPPFYSIFSLRDHML